MSYNRPLLRSYIFYVQKVRYHWFRAELWQ